jgi:hypothetical protein
MKKLIQVLCSVFFATTISLPADALSNPVENIDDTTKEQSSDYDSYHLALITGDFGLQYARMDSPLHPETPMIFVSDPAGKIINNAQVITTIITPEGDQFMHQAYPIKNGYLLPTNHLSPGRYRIEAEVIIQGCLLTDEFSFVKA